MSSHSHILGVLGVFAPRRGYQEVHIPNLGRLRAIFSGPDYMFAKGGFSLEFSNFLTKSTSNKPYL